MLAPVAASGVLILGGLNALLLLLSLPFPGFLPPMALPTSLCFVVASVVLLIWGSRRSAVTAVKFALSGGLLLYSLFGLYEAVSTFPSRSSPLLGLPSTTVEMYYVTALTFALFSAGLLSGLFIDRAKWLGHGAGLLACVAILVGATWTYGFWFGFVDGKGIGPMRLLTSLCFLLLGLGLIARIGANHLPLSFFSGDRPRARLLRALVPTVVGLVLLQGMFVQYVTSFRPINAAVVTMLSSLILAAGLGVAISRVARRIGEDIESAVKAQQWAEMNLRRAIEGLELTINDRTADLRRSNESLEQFARVASHDLQEPLRKIRAFGDLLTKKILETGDEEAKDYVQRMQKASTRMSALIDALLAYSRLTTKAQRPAPVSLDLIFDEVVSDLEVKIEDTGAKIEKDALPVVEADAMQMRQLFQNLLGNALKFHKPGLPPEIHVSTKKLGEGWEFRFDDKGIGFDPKYAERIFQVFERLHGKNEYEGTGIGLAICKRIVDRHHGKLVAEGRPGDGASFVFTLPSTQASRWAQAA